ncbi:MAG: sugar ABC transporter substrate-binding protein [Synergistaceae bacterium]|nr:sugar ABC transporter substrate-binding protein [Synergistaceae bacterium]
MKLRKFLLFVTVFFMAVSVIVFGGSLFSSSAEAAPVKIGLSMDSLESAFWIANYKAMVEKAKEMGVEMVEMMAEGDPNKQNQQIENLIAQGVSAIICAPKDGGAIVAAVRKCKAAGIPIIMNNRPVQGEVEPDLQILSDNYVMAKQAAQWFVDKAKADGKTYKALLFIGNLGDENAVERHKGHREVFDANKDIVEVVIEVPTEWNHEIAMRGMQNAFQAHPEISVVVTPSDFLFPPLKSVLEQLNKWAKIGEPNHMPIVSFDGDEVGCKYLIEGYNWVNAAQAADETGRLCVEWAVKLSQGEKPAEKIMRDPGVILTIDNQKEVGPSVWGYVEATK